MAAAVMMDPTEYDTIAGKLESDLNERFPRIVWEVDRWKMRDVYATADAAAAHLTNTAPEEFYKWLMGNFCITFSVKVGEEQLSGKTEVNSTLLTDSDVNVPQYVAGMVSREIANKILE